MIGTRSFPNSFAKQAPAKYLGDRKQDLHQNTGLAKLDYSKHCSTKTFPEESIYDKINFDMYSFFR